MGDLIDCRVEFGLVSRQLLLIEVGVECEHLALQRSENIRKDRRCNAELE